MDGSLAPVDPAVDAATLQQSALKMCNVLVKLHATLPADQFEQVCGHLARCEGPAWDVSVPATQIRHSSVGSGLMTPQTRAADSSLSTPPPPRRSIRATPQSSPRLAFHDGLDADAPWSAPSAGKGGVRAGKRKREGSTPARLRSPLVPISHAAPAAAALPLPGLSRADAGEASAAFSPSEESGAFALLALVQS